MCVYNKIDRKNMITKGVKKDYEKEIDSGLDGDADDAYDSCVSSDTGHDSKSGRNDTDRPLWWES